MALTKGPLRFGLCRMKMLCRHRFEKSRKKIRAYGWCIHHPRLCINSNFLRTFSWFEIESNLNVKHFLSMELKQSWGSLRNQSTRVDRRVAPFPASQGIPNPIFSIYHTSSVAHFRGSMNSWWWKSACSWRHRCSMILRSLCLTKWEFAFWWSPINMFCSRNSNHQIESLAVLYRVYAQLHQVERGIITENPYQLQCCSRFLSPFFQFCSASSFLEDSIFTWRRRLGRMVRRRNCPGFQGSNYRSNLIKPNPFARENPFKRLKAWSSQQCIQHRHWRSFRTRRVLSLDPFSHCFSVLVAWTCIGLSMNKFPNGKIRVIKNGEMLIGDQKSEFLRQVSPHKLYNFYAGYNLKLSSLGTKRRDHSDVSFLHFRKHWEKGVSVAVSFYWALQALVFCVVNVPSWLILDLGGALVSWIDSKRCSACHGGRRDEDCCPWRWGDYPGNCYLRSVFLVIRPEVKTNSSTIEVSQKERR